MLPALLCCAALRCAVGTLWDLALQPALRPLAMPLAEAWLDRQDLAPFTMPSAIQDVLPLIDSETRLGEDGTAHTSILVTPRLGNPIGSIHGGAAVVLSAHVAQMALANWLPPDSKVHATQIRANLLAGIPTTKDHKASVMVTTSRAGHAWHATADINLNRATAIDSQVWFHVE